MKRKIHLTLFTATLITFSISAQTVSTFEALTLAPNTYWNGSDSPKGASFTNGNAVFKNYYDTYWSQGFAYSNKTDTITAGYTNMYAAIAGRGYNGSEKYAVGQQNAVVRLTGPALWKPVTGVYVTNGTYAALSMKNGDDFAKKFGGASGNDPDWFKLTIKKYYKGVVGKDSVEFYLADFRSADNSQDYIVKKWRWVELTALGDADSLKFSLSSSDIGNFGMNTPAFFCIDNFTTRDIPLTVAKVKPTDLQVSLYPNPASEQLNVELLSTLNEKSVVEIIDVMGKVVYSESLHNKLAQLPIGYLTNGIYNLRATNDAHTINKLFIKQ